MSESEIAHKLGQIRAVLSETGAAGVRLRGTDWFAWATAGGSNTVLLAAETGVAEVLVTPDNAWILTDEIEVKRLQEEEVTAGFEWAVNPWAAMDQRESFVESVTHGKVLSDTPKAGEAGLPDTLIHHKRTLISQEIERYREVGRLASEAMTETLNQAQSDWTGYQLAGAGANALWKRGLHPNLTLVAGERRLPVHRHATAKDEKLGQIAMLVFCARGYGLYANLTRFVAFGPLSDEQETLHRQVREVEAIALDDCQNGTPLNQIYFTLKQAYADQGRASAIVEHHQGGTTGYLSREIVANPTTDDTLAAPMAMAWNPSLPGAKIEDTFLLHEDGSLENLTFDPNWPHVEVSGRKRPIPLVR